MDGFWALTDTGIFQIDGTSFNYGCRYHQVLTTSSGQLPVAGSNFGRVYSVATPIIKWQFTAYQPVVAVYAPGNAVTMVSCTNLGSNVWEALFWSIDGNTSFEVFVFDQMDQITAGANYGLKVYNSAGQLCADATVPFLRPIAFIQTQAGNFSPGWQGSGTWPRGFINDYSQPAFSKVAVGCIQTGQTNQTSSNNSDGSSGLGFMSASFWYTNGGTVQMQWKDHTFGSPSGGFPGTFVGYGSQLNIAGMLIDVANIP